MSEEKNKLKSTWGNFIGVGRVKVSKNGFEIDVPSKNNPDYISSKLQLHLDCGKERISFAELWGGYDTNDLPVIKAFGKTKDGKTDFKNQIEIDWDDREDEDVLDDVSDYSLIKVGLEKYVDAKDKKEKILYKKFLTAYDAVPYIQEHLVEDSVVKIMGNLKFSEYNGKTTVHKEITSIYLTNAEEDKFSAKFRLQLLIDKESLGEKEEDGLVPLTGNVVTWHKKGKQNIVSPFTIYIDPTQFPKWETHTKKKFQPKKRSEVWAWGLEGKFAIETETVEVTLDDLSDDLREMVEEGIITKEEALTRAVGSNKSKEVMLFTSFLTRKDTNGLDVFDKQDELYTTDDYVFASAFEEKDEDVEEDEDEKPKQTKKTTKKQENKDPFEKVEKTTSADDDEWADLLDGLE